MTKLLFLLFLVSTLQARPLNQAEKDFLNTVFFNSLDTERINLTHRNFVVRNSGRSTSGSNIILNSNMVEIHADGTFSLELDLHYEASTFAHEAFHVWQRQQGYRVSRMRVTRPRRHGNYYYLLRRFPVDEEHSDQELIAMLRPFRVEAQAEYFSQIVAKYVRYQGDKKRFIAAGYPPPTPPICLSDSGEMPEWLGQFFSLY